MAKIAVEFEPAVGRSGTKGAAPHGPSERLLAGGHGWNVRDLHCASGPQDRPYEERHSQVSIAIVLEGTFQYRAANGHRSAGELMTPGSLLLGNTGQHFECGHEHSSGDHCLSFHFAPDDFERIAADSGAGRGERKFRMLRLPAVRALSSLVARACAKLAKVSRRAEDCSAELSWEEISIQLAARAVRLANGVAPDTRQAQPSAIARVTRAVRMIGDARKPDLSIERLAREAGLSPYHFLRTFQELTGVTPHQYVRRARLRAAAARLANEQERVLDVALDCGFGDVSNFNRAFRNEFGVNPQRFRRAESPLSGSR